MEERAGPTAVLPRGGRVIGLSRGHRWTRWTLVAAVMGAGCLTTDVLVSVQVQQMTVCLCLCRPLLLTLFTCAPAMTWSNECTTNALATTSFSRFVALSTWLRCLLRGAQASLTHTPKAITSAVLITDPCALGVRSRGRVSSRHKQCLLLAPTVSPVIHLCTLFFLSAVARQVHTSTEDCTVWPTTLFRSVCGRCQLLP
jgi:hypothetical protein